MKAILAFAVLSTTLHYTHNFAEVGEYPQSSLISDTGVQVAIVVSWPLLTALGLLGYRHYSQRRYSLAHACLLGYAPLGLSTPAHFLQGTPDVAPLWFATIFTDGLAGLAVVAFVVLSAREVATARRGAGAAVAAAGDH